MTTRKTTKTTSRAAGTRPQRAAASRRAPAKAAKTTKRTPKKPAPAVNGHALATLPERLVEIPYVARTRSILERSRRREARLRADTLRELQGVLHDLKTDALAKFEEAQVELHAKFDPIVDKARETRLGTEVERIPERLTGVADEWLDKVGLVRKARVAA